MSAAETAKVLGAFVVHSADSTKYNIVSSPKDAPLDDRVLFDCGDTISPAL